MEFKIVFSYKQMLNNFCLLVVFVTLFLPISSQAQDVSERYSRAYNICSPVAHQITKKQCNYGRTFEGYYEQCMYEQGYGDDDINRPNYYEGYLQAHQYCSSVSEQNTREYCSYGRLYNNNYNTCMRNKGFDEHGEVIAGYNGGEGKHFKFDF